MKTRVILIENNDDINYAEGLMQGILEANNIKEYVIENFTERLIQYQFIATDEKYMEIINILKRKFVKYREAKIEIKLK